jgi:hypothetical protein
MSEQVENLRIAYQILERNVIRALRTQRGDSAQLTIQANEALHLLQAAEPVHSLIMVLTSLRSDLEFKHRTSFEASEYAILQQSVAAMVNELDQVGHFTSVFAEDATHCSSAGSSSVIRPTRRTTSRRGSPRRHRRASAR